MGEGASLEKSRAIERGKDGELESLPVKGKLAVWSGRSWICTLQIQRRGKDGSVAGPGTR